MPVLTRPADWPERLAAFIEGRRLVPFAWGSNDCCCFAADAVQALTGVDLAAAFRGTYDTEFGAARALLDHGSVLALATAMLGEPRELPKLAQRGDVVWYAQDDRQMLGIVVGNGEWCGPGEQGLAFNPMDDVAVVWRV
jgi:hypothetical protein